MGGTTSASDIVAILWPLAKEKYVGYIQVGPMSECIRGILAAQGFQRLCATADNWTLAWGSTMPEDCIARMNSKQAHNHIPGWDKLNNKGMLAEIGEKCRAHDQKLADNLPKSWVLPGGMKNLLRDSACGGGPYIMKPIGGTRGRGIKLYTELTEEHLNGVSRVVVQRYIKNPDLINGRKYDLRLYVCATSACPMRIYLHEQGYARLCSQEYDLKRPEDLFRHLTNSNFQKLHKAYDLNRHSTRQAAAGNKWHLDVVKEHWRKKGM